jgi:hypothetical protein
MSSARRIHRHLRTELRWFERRLKSTKPKLAYVYFFFFQLNSFDLKEIGGLVHTIHQNADVSIQAFKSGVAVNDVTKMTNWVATEDGANRVVKAMKDALLAVKYMNNPTVNANYLAQGNRVAAQFTAAENGVQANWANTGTPYTVLGLETGWRRFSKSYLPRCSQPSGTSSLVTGSSR